MEGQHHTNNETPRIYAASLSDYNNGRLHGDWIDAAREPEDIQEDIEQMLRTSEQPGAEEWAIHDYEHFGAFEPHEYESIKTISRIAIGLTLHGPAFAHWAQIVGTENEEALDSFDDHYLGQWDSLAAYAEDYLDDMGIKIEGLVPGWLGPYVSIDYGQLGSDISSDLEVARDSEGQHLFSWM